MPKILNKAKLTLSTLFLRTVNCLLASRRVVFALANKTLTSWEGAVTHCYQTRRSLVEWHKGTVLPLLVMMPLSDVYVSLLCCT